MKTALIVITLMGCNCGSDQCELIRSYPTHWSSVEACETELRDRIQTLEGERYPVVTGVCETGEDAQTRLAGRLQTPVEIAALPVAEPPAASGKHGSILLRTKRGYMLVRREFLLAVGSTGDFARSTTGWLLEKVTRDF